MKKAVIASSSFLWKKPAANAVLDIIQQHPQTALHSFLTREETMKLYEDKLVDSEVLYGTVVEVIAEKDGWAEVILLDQASNRDERGYPGFVPQDTLIEVEPEYEEIQEKIAVILPQTTLHLAAGSRPLAFGTVLPLLEEHAAEYVVATPEGPGRLAKNETQKTNQYTGSEVPKRMIALAEQFMDLPYVWAGISGSGFDCSGFMYSLHRVHNILIPRDTIEEAQSGKQVAYKDALPGDLLLFAYEEGKGEVHHVGLYLGNDEMIHSQTPGSKVLKTTIQGSKYEPELAVVARYWEESEVR